MLTITVKDGRAFALGEIVVAGSVLYPKVRFVLPDEWRGLTVVAQFDGCGHTVDLVNVTSGGEYAVPWECITEAGILNIAVRGYLGDEERTTVHTSVRVHESGLCDDGAAAAEPTPGAYEQLLGTTQSVLEQGQRLEAAAERVERSLQAVSEATNKDWAQNDEQSPHYIHNRTHYEYAETDRLPVTFDATADEYGAYPPMPFTAEQAAWLNEQLAGCSKTTEYNQEFGINITNFDRLTADIGGAIWQVGVFEGNDEVFVYHSTHGIMSIGSYVDGVAEATELNSMDQLTAGDVVAFIVQRTAVKPLDEKFLPESVATKAHVGDVAARLLSGTKTAAELTLDDVSEGARELRVVSHIVLKQDEGTPTPDSPLPIGGSDAVTLTVSGEGGEQTFTAALGQSVYGGSFDWDSGLLTIDKKKLVINGTDIKFAATANGETWKLSLNELKSASGVSGTTSHTVSNLHFNATAGQIYMLKSAFGAKYGFESKDAFNEFLVAQNAAGTPFEVIYYLAEPITVQLTPQAITAPDGAITLSSDTGDTTATYYRDISKAVAAIEAALGV